MRNLTFTLWLAFFMPVFSFAQDLIPQDLFDAGINLAYLEVHSAEGTDPEIWPTWAANAGAEWASAWEEKAGTLIPEGPFPSDALTVRDQMIHYMLTNAPEGCLSPWHQGQIAVFEAGYYMGRAFAQSNYDCASCVQASLFDYAQQLDRIGNLDIADRNMIIQLAGEARKMATDLREVPDGEQAREVLENLASGIQDAIGNKNMILPNRAFACDNNPVEEVPVPENINMADWRVEFGRFTSTPTQIEASPAGDRRTSYYLAPPTMHGDWSDFQSLIFEKKSWGGTYFGADQFAAHGDVILISGNKSARFDIPANHNQEWTRYTVPLYDESVWILTGASSLAEILCNVTDLKIRAEYGSGNDHSSLRGVRLVR
jgi:hypothetical protein